MVSLSQLIEELGVFWACILIKVTRRQLLWVCVCTRVSPVARRSYFVLFCLSKSAAKTLFDIQHRIISLKSWATCSANIFRILSRTLFKGDLCRICLYSPALRPTLPTCLLSSLSHAAKRRIWQAFRVDKYFALKSWFTWEQVWMVNLWGHGEGNFSRVSILIPLISVPKNKEFENANLPCLLHVRFDCYRKVFVHKLWSCKFLSKLFRQIIFGNAFEFPP